MTSFYAGHVRACHSATGLSRRSALWISLNLGCCIKCTAIFPLADGQGQIRVRYLKQIFFLWTHIVTFLFKNSYESTLQGLRDCENPHPTGPSTDSQRVFCVGHHRQQRIRCPAEHQLPDQLHDAGWCACRLAVCSWTANNHRRADECGQWHFGSEWDCHNHMAYRS